MNIFGKYSKDHKKHTFEKAPDTYWVFRFPTAEDEAAMSRFVRNNPPSTDIFVMELALTFQETNLGGEEPYIEADTPLSIRRARIGEMPHEMVVELARALKEYASGWGATVPNNED